MSDLPEPANDNDPTWRRRRDPLDYEDFDPANMPACHFYADDTLLDMVDVIALLSR